MKIRRVDLYSDDALTGTTELSDDEMGVYVRVWLLMYATGGPISIEKLKSVCLSHGTRFKNIVKRLETLGKVAINGQRITCKRCEKEIQRALNRLTKSSQNGAKGGRPKDLEKPAGSNQNNPTSLQQPTTNNQQEDSPYGELPPLIPPKEVKSNGRSRKTRLPADWQPDEEDRRYALSKGYDDAWIDEQAAACRDWNLMHEKLYCDHHAHWRTWVRNAEKFGGARGNGAARPRQDVGRNQGVVAIVGKLIAEEEGWGLPH